MAAIRKGEDTIIALLLAKRKLIGRSSSLLVGLLFVVAGITFLLSTHAATPVVSTQPETGTITAPAKNVADPTASGGQAVQFAAPQTGNCNLTLLLVNPCHPLLGAFANKYPQPGAGLKNQILYHEQRIGRQLDVVKDFARQGDVLTADDKFFATRANTILQLNWQVVVDTATHQAKWSDAGGGNATVNSQIDAMADSIKSVAPHKIMLAIAHEPEHSVSPDSNCPSISFKGAWGTPTDYRNMWANVRRRFDAKGVNNVVWDMIYAGTPSFLCIDNDLYPGDNLVDWVTWDPYNFGSNTMTWDSKINVFYNWLSTNTDATHSFTSKPWGLTEWGMSRGVTQAATYAYYDEAKAAVEANAFPRLKLYIIFDSVGPNSNGTFDDIRTLYDVNGHLDQTEQNHYNAFANSPAFKNP